MASFNNLFDRPINQNEKEAISALILYRAIEMNITPYVLENALISHFAVEAIERIRGQQYDYVIEFLVLWIGMN